jgi:D-amino-acid dehydrogenase
MKVAVIGAGVVGVTTAYFLRQKQYEVHVYDRGTDAAEEASFGNGGQLSYSFVDALGDPGLVTKFPAILLGRDPGIRVRASLNPRFLSWSLRFLANCTRSASDQNTTRLLGLAKESAELMQSFHREFGAEYGYQAAGKLVLLDGQPDRSLRQRISLKQDMGINLRLVSADEAQDIEPALRSWAQKPDAAIYSRDDEVGDAHRFARYLVKTLREAGVQFHFKAPVDNIEIAGGVTGLRTQGVPQQFDAVVVCAGTHSGRLLTDVGIGVHTHPVGGYSLTLARGAASPATSITDMKHKVVFSDLGGSVRIAGFADINHPYSQREQRITQLRKVARALAPDAANYDSAGDAPWAGYRCMTPSGFPVVGATRVEGLYVNTGHGMFGWTLAAASAAIVADRMTA